MTEREAVPVRTEQFYFDRGHPVVLILTIAYIIQMPNTTSNIYLIINEWATSFGQ